MSDPDNIPKAVWSGEFKIGTHVLRCHVLEDGRRIIDADDLNAFFMGGSVTLNHEDIVEFAKWSKGL